MHFFQYAVTDCRIKLFHISLYTRPNIIALTCVFSFVCKGHSTNGKHIILTAQIAVEAKKNKNKMKTIFSRIATPVVPSKCSADELPSHRSGL